MSKGRALAERLADREREYDHLLAEAIALHTEYERYSEEQRHYLSGAQLTERAVDAAFAERAALLRAAPGSLSIEKALPWLRDLAGSRAADAISSIKATLGVRTADTRYRRGFKRALGEDAAQYQFDARFVLERDRLLANAGYATLEHAQPSLLLEKDSFRFLLQHTMLGVEDGLGQQSRIRELIVYPSSDNSQASWIAWYAHAQWQYVPVDAPSIHLIDQLIATLG
jgi:hypothetical protein